MATSPLAPAQVVALIEERAKIGAYLGMVMPSQMSHPSVQNAYRRAAEIDAALASSAKRQGQVNQKFKRMLPQLIAQVKGVNPEIAAQMSEVMNGNKASVPALIAAIAGSVNPQLAALAPMVLAMFDNDEVST